MSNEQRSGLTLTDLAAIGYQIPRGLAEELIRLEGKTVEIWVKEMVKALAERWAEVHGGPLPHHSRAYRDAIHAHLRGELEDEVKETT